jgi:hypothetical protein
MGAKHENRGRNTPDKRVLLVFAKQKQLQKPEQQLEQHRYSRGYGCYAKKQIKRSRGNDQADA